MIKIIKEALRNLAGMQLNLESDVARTWIAEKVEKAIVAKQKEFNDIITEVKAVNVNTTMNVDDVIVSAMESEGYSKGDSGYDFRSGKRDIIFHASNNEEYEVTFRQLNL
mgnify:CR=1 FL=1